MSSKTAGERIAERWVFLGDPSNRRSMARQINTAIRRAVAADRRKREKKTKVFSLTPKAIERAVSEWEQSLRQKPAKKRRAAK